MFIVKKTFEISAAHMLKLDYASKCSTLHGHNWSIQVTCASKVLNKNGMVEDFTRIKERVTTYLDHSDITKKIEYGGIMRNPTAENIACYIAKLVGENCVEVSVKESEGNEAIWRRDDASL